MKYIKTFESNIKKEELYKEITTDKFLKFMGSHQIENTFIDKIIDIIYNHFTLNKNIEISPIGATLTFNKNDFLFYLKNSMVHTIDYVDKLLIFCYEDDWILIKVQSFGPDYDAKFPIFYRFFIIDSKDGLIDFLEDKFYIAK